MRHIALLFALASTIITGGAFAECGVSPVGSSFTVSNECDYTKPCLEDQPNRLTLSVDTACYPRWKPCAPFPFEACDRIEWDFGDGTTETVEGSGTVSHTWESSGRYPVSVRVYNARGEKQIDSVITIIRKPPVRVFWSGDLYTANETDDEVTLTLRREGDTTRAVTVLLGAGTRAAEGEPWDRNLEHVLDRPVVIPAGATSVPVTLKIRDDAEYLGEQRYDVYVYEDTGEALLPLASYLHLTEVRILEDESGPTLTVGDVTVTEGEGRRVLKLPHVLSAPLSKDLVLWWQIGGGTATRGVDWDTPHADSYFVHQTIPAGQLRFDLEIVLLGDLQAEQDETVIIDMEAPMGAAVSFNQPRITVTIADDDLYQLTPDSVRIDAGSSVPFEIKTTRPPAAPVEVPLASSNEAVVTVPASVTIAAGASGTAFEIRAAGPGRATVTATLPDGRSVSSEVTSVLHTAIGFLNPGVRIAAGTSSIGSLTTTPPAATLVTLEARPAGVVTVPDVVQLSADGTATFPIEALQPGTATVIATLPAEYGGTSERLTVNVEPVLSPHIGAVVPPFGPSSGGNLVTITGSDFAPDCAVLFGGVLAESSWKDNATLTATAPAHGARSVDVAVRCGEQEAVLANGYLYQHGRRRAVR